MLDYRISEAAERDIQSVIDHTLDYFGEDALDRYLTLIDLVIQTLRRNPEHGVEFSNAIQKIHLSSFKKKAPAGTAIVKNPRHVLFYRVNGDVLEIIRLLHDAMDFGSHLR